MKYVIAEDGEVGRKELNVGKERMVKKERYSEGELSHYKFDLTKVRNIEMGELRK